MRRIVSIVFCVWLLALAARFCGETATHAERSFRPGHDWAWFCAWIAAVLALFLTTAILPAKKSFIVWVIPIAAAGALLSLSGSWPAAAIAMWLVLLSASIGIGTVRALVGSDGSWAEQVVCGIPIGVGCIGLVVLVLGLRSGLTPTAVWILLTVLSFWSVWKWHSTLRGWIRNPKRSRDFRDLETRTETTILGGIMALQ